MADANFIQVIENLDEVFFGATESESICAFIGEKSKKIKGIKICSVGKVRKIWFSDIDRLEQIVKEMKGEK